jgi:hypothetical protein
MTRNIIKPVTKGGPAWSVRTWDADAVAYFDRVVAAGGSFASASFTDTVTRAVINDYVIALKDFSVWSKITEAYLFVGPTFAGVFQKLKHAGVPALTNVNFVSGDLVQSGIGAGLKGNASSKIATSAYTITGAQIGDLSFGAYASDVPTGTTAQSIMGCRSGTAVVQLGNASAGQHMHFGNPGRVNFTTGIAESFMVGTSTGSGVRIFRNGGLDATGPAGTYTGTPNQWALFENGNGAERSAARIRFAFVGATLTDTEAANLSTITNALMTKLGANVY